MVLDEAHQIKDRRTNTAQAVFLLKARYRWALSGTPLQNRVNELYSQIRFLRINPYSYFFCRACECRSLQYPFKNDYRRCFACGHAPTQHICWWNTMIANKVCALECWILWAAASSSYSSGCVVLCAMPSPFHFPQWYRS